MKVKSELEGKSENFGKTKIICLRLGVLLLSVALLIFAARYRDSGKSVKGESTKYDFAMGTAVSVTVYGGNDVPADVSAQNIVDEVKKLDSEVISWRDEGSELTKFNGAASGKTVKVSEELFSAIEESLNICEDSGGALDITLRPLLDCWNIEDATEENFSVPGDEEIQESLAKTGYEKLTVEASKDGGDIKKLQDITVDLGATGKGYALDVVRGYLDENDISGAIVTVGGSVMVYGNKSNGESWKVGIRDPKGDAEDMVGYLEITDVDYICVSTSGDYEKYVEYDGKRYHHILDRNTGYPAESGLSSVTIVCRSGIDSDGLSTACFVLGQEKAVALLEKYDAEALFIDNVGNITMTEGLKKYFVENRD